MPLDQEKPRALQLKEHIDFMLCTVSHYFPRCSLQLFLGRSENPVPKTVPVVFERRSTMTRRRSLPTSTACSFTRRADVDRRTQERCLQPRYQAPLGVLRRVRKVVLRLAFGKNAPDHCICSPAPCVWSLRRFALWLLGYQRQQLSSLAMPTKSSRATKRLSQKSFDH